MKPKEFNNYIGKLKTNKKVFDELYNYYFPKIVIHILVQYKDKDFSEDVAQEFFLKLFKLKDIPYIEYPNTWVYTIAENIAKNKKAKEKVMQELQDNFVAATEDTFDFELYGEYYDLLNKLDEQTHRIIVMKIFEGYKFKEIAEVMDLNPDTVRQKFSRGIKKLKMLSQKCF